MKKRLISILVCFAALIALTPSGFAAGASLRYEGKLLSATLQTIDGAGYVELLSFLDGISAEYTQSGGRVEVSFNGRDAAFEEGESAIVDRVTVALAHPVRAAGGSLLASLDDLVYTLYLSRTDSAGMIDLARKQTASQGDVDYNQKLEAVLNGKASISLIKANALFQPDSYAGLSPSNYTVKEVTVTGQPFSKAVEVESFRTPSADYEYQFRMALTGTYNAGDVGMISFYARALETMDESDHGFIGCTMEKNSNTSQKAVTAGNLPVGRDWTKIYIPVTSASVTCPVGDAKFCLRFGYKPQKIQVADLKVVSYGTAVKVSDLPEKVSVYQGMEEDAIWRTEAEKRIEKYRKEDLDIYVHDKNGKPIPDARVQIEMTRSEFLFGTAVSTVALDENAAYQEKLKKYFNSVTPVSDQKWDTLEPNQGKNVAKVYNWATANNLYARGHCLLWDDPKYFPADFKNSVAGMSDGAVRSRVEEHLNIAARFTQGVPVQWDVLNEPVRNDYLRSRLGGQELVRWFDIAAAADPSAKRYINETHLTGDRTNPNEQKLYSIVQDAVAQGARVDGAALQCHAAGEINYPQDFYNQLDRYAQLVDEVAVTEYDYIASNAGDAKNHLRDYLLAVYSHPQATGFTMWGFWDGKHDKNNAPLFYQDWTPKPALAAWEDLVLNEWRTSETAVTGSDGHAAVRGHRGEYRVTIELYGGLKKQSVDCRLSKDGDNRVDITIGTSISMTAANPVPERPPLVDAANYGTMADIPNSMRIVSPQGEKFTEGSNHVEAQIFSYDFSTRLKGTLIAAVMKKQDGQDAVEAVYTGETVDTAEPNAAAAVDFSVTDAADKTVRLFVWDSVDGMRPFGPIPVVLKPTN